jgi:nitrite reductase/ring-hydroxylating ferredoxin subunit
MQCGGFAGSCEDDGVADFVRIAAAAEIPDWEIRGYDLPGARIAVANVDGRFHAFSAECPYEGCDLSEGTIEDGEAVVCPEDRSAFDVESGEPLRGPAEDVLPVYATRVDMGWIEVALS